MLPDPADQHTPTRSLKHRAARRFGAKIPIFPCKADKTPYTQHGHLDATTDPRRINAWWNRYPNANPATPTGERSGFFVLDVDLEAWGAGSLEALETAHGELPTTYTVKTGGGGLHYYFRLPERTEIRNSAGKLGLGLDVRGEGGYVLLPTSTTEGTYEVLENHPMADAPAWLVEALREPHSSRSGGTGGTREPTAIFADNDGPPIVEGTRDDTLARIAGKLHDGTRSLEALAAGLWRINEARCQPPLPERQVLKIARSIHIRPPCNPAPATTPETVEALAEIEAELWRHEWRGMGGKSERDAYAAAIVAARRYGTRIPAGIRVSMDIRSWALAAAVSKRAMLDYWKHGERKPGIISRLKRRGLLRSDNTHRSGTKAGAFVLLMPRAEFHHSTTPVPLRTTESASGETLRAPRLRWSAPVFKRIGDEIIRATIRRLGKGCGAVIDALERAGGSATVEELADALHKNRTRDLRRRLIARLVTAGVVECSTNTVSLAADWMEALNRERELTGEIAAYQRDMSRYARERDAYRNRRRIRPDRAPSERELHHRQESYPDRRRQAIKAAIAALFRERPEYRTRTVGQVTCALVMFKCLAPDFPPGPIGLPKNEEVEEILSGVAA